MKNYGHRFACGAVCCFYLAAICVLRNQFSFDVFGLLKKAGPFGTHELWEGALFALFVFPQAVFLDNLVEKRGLSEGRRDGMYFSIMGVSIAITALSFAAKFL